ncbi:transmembrane 220 family protein [Maribacter halichondriae]|uniref:transmembrane 220 family protein n=1 Tax=Maribacter halichondriae TaxID=2980554 RepID=UPI002358AC55|nr:transmembrane 220 family protein [Maribacter sp. Hal144]
MGLFFKLFGWLFGILCLTSAVLQYNDPDPMVWILIYLVAAIVSFVFALNKVRAIVPFLFGLMAILGCWYVFPEKFQGFDLEGGDINNIEEGREAIGLLIIALVMFVYAYWIHFSHKNSKV